jgi:hypothetical protein
MDLQSNSQEYAHIVFSIAPSLAATVDASVDLATWQTVTFGSNGEGQVLLRGPRCTGTQGLLVTKTAPLWIRVVDDPEIVIRSAGIVSLY